MSDVQTWLFLANWMFVGFALIGVAFVVVRKVHIGAAYMLIAAGATMALGSMCEHALWLQVVGGEPAYTGLAGLVGGARYIATALMVAIALVALATRVTEHKASPPTTF